MYYINQGVKGISKSFSGSCFYLKALLISAYTAHNDARMIVKCLREDGTQNIPITKY